MRVLFLSRLYWPHVGGVEKHVEEIGKRLKVKDKSVTVVTTKYDKRLKYREKKDGLQIVRFVQPRIKYLGLIYTWLWMLKNIDLIKESDIVHAHDVFIWYLPFRFLFPNKKVYTTFHGWEGKYPVSGINIVHKKIAAKLSSKTIAVGEYINKHYRVKSSIITYGAVNNVTYNDISYINKGAKKEIIRILYVGRLNEDTGLTIFFKALDNYRDKVFSSKRDKRFTIDFCGDGTLRKECEKYGRVYGFVDPGPFYKKASICLVSGYLTILEAMANKCLIICAYDNALKKDYYQLTPFKKWIIYSNSPKDIADKIADFSNNQAEYQKIIEAGYNWVKEQSWEKLANAYLILWEIKTT